METLFVNVSPFVVKVLPFVVSVGSVVFTAIVKYQLEKAKHQFAVQSQFHLESHKMVWELWKTYYNLTGVLESILTRDCENDLKEEYVYFYGIIVKQKRLFAPIISSKLDKKLERFLDYYHPISVCSGTTGERYQKLHKEIVSLFRRDLK